MFFSKKVKDEYSFISEILKSMNLIETGHFDDALKEYYHLKDYYDKNRQTIPIEDRRGFKIYSNILILYLKTIELKFLYSNSRFREVKDALEYMNFIIYETKALSRSKLASLDYMEEEFFEYSKKYMYNFYKSQIYYRLKDIYRLLELGVGDSARIKYEQISRIYNKMADYCTHEQRNNLYVQLEKLKQEIDLVELREKAYSKPSKFEISDENIKKPHVEIEKRDLIGTQTVQFDDTFNKMHEYLKRNNVDGAIRLYNNI